MNHKYFLFYNNFLNLSNLIYLKILFINTNITYLKIHMLFIIINFLITILKKIIFSEYLF